MPQALTEDQVTPTVLGFIRERFLDGDPRGELTEETPLLEWGILNSLNTAVLIAWIREHFERDIPIAKVNASTFRTVRTLSAAVCD